MSATTTTNKAVYLSKADGAQVKQGPGASHELADDEVLIRNVAVASNPKDWKMAKWGIFEGIEGNDVAGTVEKLGANVTSFRVGERVGAFTRMATHDKYGAYQPFSVSPQHTVFRLGDKTSYEQAATLPLAALTAVVGLYARLQLPQPGADGSAVAGAEKQGVFVWGAASSVGAYAVQLAKRAGHKVVAVAGSSTDYARSLGADAVVNYRSADVEAELVAAAKGLGVPFHHAYDAISEHGSTSTLAKALAKLDAAASSAVTTVLPTPEEQDASLLPANVKVVRTMVGTAHKEDAELCRVWSQRLADWVDAGEFRPNNVKIVEGGLDGVREGLALLEQGKVSAAKLVYRIADTKA